MVTRGGQGKKGRFCFVLSKDLNLFTGLWEGVSRVGEVGCMIRREYLMKQVQILKT